MDTTGESVLRQSLCGWIGVPTASAAATSKVRNDERSSRENLLPLDSLAPHFGGPDAQTRVTRCSRSDRQRLWKERTTGGSDGDHERSYRQRNGSGCAASGYGERRTEPDIVRAG